MLNRRQFLISLSAVSGLAALSPVLSWSSTGSADSDTEHFYHLSLLLTARTNLSHLVSSRALHCLTAEDKSFPQQITTLLHALREANITSSDQLNGHEMMQQPVGQTIRKIISAWYLGFTGTPISLRAKDSTQFVTFTDALMFQPTLDATIIPTYSRGHTNYWTQPPATIKHD
ncbi:hypothetical protein EFZ10_13700 [Tatumella sp. TA1]|uniref:sugar dehydrogenase complex small subunit n=1 Tax=Rosenbergiella collisarenosi TaxID=1544695 RepID=UPI0008F7FA48|nr:sugar dehydrogenase complex small subunit [Rosenbergiella collisarenosi]QGX92589.1 hypothetical protein EFZ10_13700 [Tatumella sp. TA1]